jgi:hypothetical protein
LEDFLAEAGCASDASSATNSNNSAVNLKELPLGIARSTFITPSEIPGSYCVQNTPLSNSRNG